MKNHYGCTFWSVTALLVFCAMSRLALARTWTSKDGRFTVEAELLDVTGSEIRLRKSNSAEITVALEKLSDDDREFIVSWKKRRAKESAADGTRKSTAIKSEDDPKLVPITFKVLDDELSMEVPKGAKIEKNIFPTIRVGKKFQMLIQPHSEDDLTGFRNRYTKWPDKIAMEKILVDEDDAAAYKVKMKAFNESVSVYMVVVTVGEKKYTCMDASMDEMNQKEKLSPKDVELMIRCARTLKARDPITEAVSTPATK